MTALKPVLVKLLFASFIVATFAMPVQQASAQIPVTDAGAITALNGFGTGTGIITGIRKGLSATCQTAITAFNASQTVETVLDTTSSTAFGLIGGSAAEATKITAKLAKAQVAKGCADAYVTALSAAPTVIVTVGQDLQREQDKFTKISASLQQVITDLNAQQNASVKDILKAFMVKVILNLNQNLTTQLVNKMVDKFKISNYLQYGDALASQVYSMDYINENFAGDARQQMMVRSILQSSLVPSKVQTAQAFAVSKAQEYTSSACQAAVDNYNSSNTNDFWNCIAKLGNENSSPQFHYFQAVDQAAVAEAAGKASATQELAQSNGYAPPRDCSGSVAQQKVNDDAYDRAAQELDTAQVISARLASAALDGKADPSEVTKANEALAAAEAKLNAVPNTVPNPIISICKAIDSPSSFISTSISDFLKSHLDEGNSLKSDNLPFYANFLAGVTSNFLTNILTGGKSTSQVLKESGIGALNGAIIGISQTAGSGAPSGTTGGTGGTTNPGGSFTLYVTQAGQTAHVTSVVPGRSYTLHADFSSIGGLSAQTIRMQGFAQDDVHQVTDNERQTGSVSYDFDAIAGNSYKFTATLSFFNSTPNDALTATLTVPVAAVQGVSTILPRGPQVSPR